MQELPQSAGKRSTINPDMSRTPFCKACIKYRAVVSSVYARFTTLAAEAVCLYAKQPCLRGFPRFPPLTDHSQAYASTSLAGGGNILQSLESEQAS